MPLTAIQQIQGPGLLSPLAGRRVQTRGVVTGTTRKGFFLQDPDGDLEGSASVGVFVFSPRAKPPLGSFAEVDGEVIDFVPDDHERPTTQVVSRQIRVVQERGPAIEPVWLTAPRLACSNRELADHLNRLEGMLLGIEAGAVFVAPSNPFGDYVVLPPGVEAPRTRHGGVRIDPHQPERWYPSFRIVDYDRAPRLDVGARLLEPVIGPLNFRASSFQIAAVGDLAFAPATVVPDVTTLAPAGDLVTVLTLNGFNLDHHLEDPSRVHDRRRDVDDDLGEGRFDMLARAVVEQAGGPDVVALQEIQDDDGAEISERVASDANYRTLVAQIDRLGGPRYRWADIPPGVGEDGGQPGGNIRNGFLYRTDRVELRAGSLRRLGDTDPAFVDSRKPLLARFRWPGSGREIAMVNVHLASKRQQRGIFAPEGAGEDPRLAVRVRQAEILGEELDELDRQEMDYYVTGDFNDFEFSDTLRTLVGTRRVNLVDLVPEGDRYDYNHRGVSQVLMHGVVSNRQAAGGRLDYEILHGNELIGARPGELGTRPTDHAYVVARL